MPNKPVGIADSSARTLLVTADDQKRLQRLIHMAKLKDPRGSEYLDSLEGELAAARVVASEEIPPDVVTMNSRVHLSDLDTGETIIFTLVYPERADLDKARVSVLAPIGTAVLGYRAGDTILWRVPDGVRRLKVLEVLYQPEASGDSDSEGTAAPRDATPATAAETPSAPAGRRGRSRPYPPRARPKGRRTGRSSPQQ